MLFTERFSRLEKYNTELTPMHVVFDELANGLEGYEISREGDNQGTQKQHKDFNFNENFYSSFIIDFFLPIYGNAKWNPRFTESVNSDKNTVPKIIIELGKILQSKDASQKIQDTLGDAYRLCFLNMVYDFKKIQDTYNEGNQTNIVLSPENNFQEFNEWCASQPKKVDPLTKLNEMVLFYNSSHRNKPIAIAENVHYHINKKTKNVEMVFSFIEALGRYTILTDKEYNDRIKAIDDELGKTSTTQKEKFRLQRVKDSLQLTYKPVDLGKQGISNVFTWNSRILNLITSDITKQQLGVSYETFKQRFIPYDTDQSLLRARLGGDGNNRPYHQFIRNSNLQFISDLLRNNTTIDLKDSELKKEQLHEYIENVVRKLPEYSKLLTANGSNIDDVVEKFAKEWLTYNQDILLSGKKLKPRQCDRMALGVVEVYNNKTGQYETLYEEKTIQVEDKTQTIKVPVQISSRSDLAFIDAYDSNNKKVEYYDSSYDLSKLNLKYKGRDVRIKINPLLEQYNLNHFYWATLSTFSTAGSHIWNDAKGGTNTLYEECLKWFDNNKRNVIMTATKLQFELGDVWGVPNEVNVAVVDDIVATCSGIMGDTPTVKPYDGATFVNALMYYWENNSLNNQITGTTKKPIYEFYDDRVMAGGLIKTASFAITNEMMRHSPWAIRAMWKTTKIDWTDKDGNTIDKSTPVDLTLGLESGCIGLQAVRVNGKDYLGPMYFDEVNGQQYVRQIMSFKSLGNNKYEITTRLLELDDDPYKPTKTVLINGQIVDTKEVTITNNYDFWKALGKYNSCDYDPEAKEFYYSESSLRTVAEWASKVKFRSNNGTYEQIKYGRTPVEARRNQAEDPERFSFQKDSYNQRDSRLIYCPLKEANIHYLVTKGAIKKYAANVNTNSEYFSDRALNFFKMRMLETGIQLDPTHNADQSVVSMMTQVISALAERGYTHEQAQEVYQALGELTSLAIADGMKAFQTYFTTNDRADLQEVVSKLIVEEFAFSQTKHKGNNLAQAITQRLIDEGINGKTLKFKQTQGMYPFSDPSMFGILQTTITSALNKKAIKAQLYGVLAVLNPSHEIHKMIGNKRLGELRTFEDIDEVQKYLPTLDSLSQTEIGRTYQVILDEEELALETKQREDFSKLYPGVEYPTQSLHGQIIELKDSDYYYLWKYKLANKKYKLKEIVYTQGETFTGNLEEIKNQIINSNNQFNFFTITTEKGSKLLRMDDVNDLDKFVEENGEITSIQKLNLYGRNLGSYNIHISTPNGKYSRYDLKVVQDSVLFDISNKIKEYERSIAYTNSKPIEESEEWNNLLTALKVNPEKQELYKYIARELKNVDTTMSDKVIREKQLQKDLTQISKFQQISVYDKNNKVVDVTVGSYDVKKFEAILPRIYATQFGLRRGDSIAKIINDKFFFFDRLLENYIGQKVPNPITYDVCFKRTDGKHIYIKYTENPEEFKFLGLKKVPIDKYKDDNGTYRMDPYREKKKLYPLADFSDQVFYDDLSKQEIIVTNNLQFYIDNLKYTNMDISRSTLEQEQIIRSITNSKSYICKQLAKRIKKAGGINEFITNQTKINNLIAEYISKDRVRAKSIISDKIQELDPDFYDYFIKLGQKQRTAFKQSLNFTVARIPAQGMQSFMAMEIVGFNESDVNDCYVSVEQIRLQGSDYDVDKATFMGFAFNKSGCFVKWSPFFQEQSISQLTTSMSYLPYPTGRRITIKEGNTNSIDFSKYEKLFTQKKENTEGNEEENYNNQVENSNMQLKNNRNTAKQKLLAELIREVNALVAKEVQKDNTKTEIILTHTYGVDEDLVQVIQETVNKHNLYIKRVAKEEKENLLKNFVAYKTLQISQNPVNALAGETPVDESA